MTQPAAPARIRSEYQPGRAPAIVQTWERWANEAPSDGAAAAQLAYQQLLQLRMIKLILIWTLIILPVALGIGFVVLNQALGNLSSSPF